MTQWNVFFPTFLNFSCLYNLYVLRENTTNIVRGPRGPSTIFMVVFSRGRIDYHYFATIFLRILFYFLNRKKRTSNMNVKREFRICLCFCRRLSWFRAGFYAANLKTGIYFQWPSCLHRDQWVNIFNVALILSLVFSCI